MSGLKALWEAARKLSGRTVRGNPLPPLLFVTDPERTPDPVAVARRLPGGAGVVYRAFGAADAEVVGRALAAAAAERGLTLLVGADPDLADAVGAHGVHLPERDLARAAEVRRRRPDWIVIGAVHGGAALRAAEAAGLDAALASPVFPTRSAAARPVIGPEAFERWAASTSLPLYALGGVTADTAALVPSAAGLAAVDGVVQPMLRDTQVIGPDETISSTT